MRKTYPTDLSDAEWECIEPHLPTTRAAGRPRKHSSREILNAIFFIVRSGCAWRLLPHEFAPWKTIHHYFRIWPSTVPGSDYTLPYAIVCECASKEILNRARA
jgi:putative transposase